MNGLQNGPNPNVPILYLHWSYSKKRVIKLMTYFISSIHKVVYGEMKYVFTIGMSVIIIEMFTKINYQLVGLLSKFL